MIEHGGAFLNQFRPFHTLSQGKQIPGFHQVDIRIADIDLLPVHAFNGKGQQPIQTFAGLWRKVICITEFQQGCMLGDKFNGIEVAGFLFMPVPAKIPIGLAGRVAILHPFKAPERRLDPCSVLLILGRSRRLEDELHDRPRSQIRLGGLDLGPGLVQGGQGRHRGRRGERQESEAGKEELSLEG